jgi:predicted AlkP superfamily pyrophosphatase or phosphodiesterase
VDHFSYDRSNSVVTLKSDSGGPGVRKEGAVFAKIVAAHAADYIIREKPNLCFIHLTDPDTVGHQFGWGSSEQLKALADVDSGLTTIANAILEAGIASRSAIIISADHGGQGKGHSRGTREDMTIPWIVWGPRVKTEFAIEEPISTCDTAATALWLLGVPPLEVMQGKPVLSAFD